MDLLFGTSPIVGQGKVKSSATWPRAYNNIGDFVKEFLFFHFSPGVDITPDRWCIWATSWDNIWCFALWSKLCCKAVHFFVNAIMTNLVHFGTGTSSKTNVSGIEIDIGVKTCQKLKLNQLVKTSENSEYHEIKIGSVPNIKKFYYKIEHASYSPNGTQVRVLHMRERLYGSDLMLPYHM